MTTLPTLTRTIDNAFTHTWYEIREDAIDNILDATPIWAVMNNAGSLKPQQGSDFITRTIRYDFQEATEIEEGDTLSSGTKEVETMAIWTWRTISTHVQRSAFDDQKNSGPHKIKDLVGTKLDSARDGIEQKYEQVMLAAFQSSETTKNFQGLNDMIPPRANRASGQYGRIDRPTAYEDNSATKGVESPSAGNTWWGPKYLRGDLNTIEDDLIDDMRRLYNGIHKNQIGPNLFITTQTLFEIYEAEALGISQLIKDEATMLADLGFEVLRFKGKPLIWTEDMTANNMLFLNTDFIDVVFDPNFWFDMTDWKPVPLQTDRIAHILCFANMVSDQLRRHGRLDYAS